MTPPRHPSYLFGLHRPHMGSEGAILRAPAGRVRARSGAGHRALGVPNRRTHSGAVSVGFAGAGRWRSRSLWTSAADCTNAHEQACGRRRAWVRVRTRACVCGCVCVYLFCVSRIQIVLSESVNNQTIFHGLTTNPTRIKQSLTASQQQRAMKQSLTDSTGVMRRQHRSTG
jgi:hypothetical protein